MKEELFNKLLEYIDAKIEEKLARNSSDGGLLESIHTRQVENELRTLIYAGH